MGKHHQGGYVGADPRGKVQCGHGEDGLAEIECSLH